MELGRIAAVLLPGASGYQGNGSGYLLSSRLVLTARHVLNGRHSCVVQLPGGAPVRCTAVWRGGSVNGADVDAALLLAEEDLRATAAPVRWGRLVTARHQPCQVAGYPDAGRRAGGRLDLQQPHATISPGTAALSHRYTVELASAPPPDSQRAPSPWSGQSGAALFCGAPGRSSPMLTGVVVTDVTGWGRPRWEAVPVYALLADPGFTDLITEHTGAAPVGEPVDLQGLIAPATGWQVRSPATLLDQRAAAVRFHGRDPLLRELAENWCAGDGVRLAVLTGQGGAGKSRLAGELSARLRNQGWICGWLDDRNPDADHSVLAEVDRPLLLVSDYAELRIPQLTHLLTILDRRPPGLPPVRLLLTARGPGRNTGGWWDQLRTRTRETRALTYDAIHRELQPLNEAADRDTHFRNALNDLAALLPQALPRVLRESTGDWRLRIGLVGPRDLNGPRYGSPLALQMTALADLLATHPATRPHDTNLLVEDQLLLHERAYWEDSAAARPELAASGPVPLADAAAMAVITAGAAPALARPLFRSAPGFRAAKDPLLGQGTSWLAEMYPISRGSCWGGLQPDRLGEYHVGERTRVSADLAAMPLVVLVATGPRAQRETPDRAGAILEALVTLSRTGATPRHWAPCARALDRALDLAPALAPHVVRAATLSDNPEPLVEALHRLTDAPKTDPALLLDLLEGIGAGRSRVLAEWAARTAAAAARGLPPAQRAVAFLHEAIWRQSAEDHDTAIRRCQDALALFSHVSLPEAVESTVRALTVLARSYRWTAGFDEATVTLDRADELISELSATRAHTAALATAETLCERAHIHTARGENEAALPLQERRVSILAALAGTDHPGVIERLADAEAHLAMSRSRSGRFREAAQTFTDATGQALLHIADEHPDSLDDDTLGSLVGRANRLRGIGNLEAAANLLREVLSIGDRPESHDNPQAAERLAAVLNNLGGMLTGMGQAEEGADLIRRSVEIRRKRAADLHGPSERLASSLLNQAIALTILERYEPAREAGEECLETCSALVRLGWEPPRLEARASRVLAETIIAARVAGATDSAPDIRRAEQLLDRSCSLYGQKLTDLPGDHLREYADTLSVLIEFHNTFGTSYAARLFQRQMLSAKRILTRGDPDLHGDEMVSDLNTAAHEHEAAGQTARAFRLRAEAVGLCRHLVKLRGLGGDRLQLATALTDYGRALSRHGRQHEPLPHLREALTVAEGARDDAEPAQYALVAARCHRYLADTLPWTGAFDEARHEVDAAEACLAPLATLDPQLYAEEMRECAAARSGIEEAAVNGPRPRSGRRRWRRRR
ncbi:tetratricopeptide repeat protein (plasmid) [Streptomyces sp. NBC_00053]|uniref:tetratricopeptide repeat protein n=1 Tax=unclassified Streptomyces TaxID=2593676 RepID=UPI00224EE8A6|nr:MULTISPECIES: tetratricopeptide repeat protein [unclassified Streptomyces]MCX4400187.1 tetratricopeptide repeat protein [Streptomyces sp. NBC_01767]MCX5106853.1 tetratricopeptide repeat protein [Streptomyces sp. NBC_00439]MCX5506232.1 tetratricopeptide repeat protein [Streptomyces sp. NBC_00052]MCX5554065.1 tetratricopeptide repeat protein [Streptomyces sp. NBC_00051]